MQVSYLPNVVDDEIMSGSPKHQVRAPSPRKIVIGRRKQPNTIVRSNSVLSSNVSLMSGLSGSCAGSIKNSLPSGMAVVGGTATPNRGPGRFVTVNLDRNTGEAEVAKQTEMVMNNLKNLQSGVVRSFSQTRDKENIPSNTTRIQSSSPTRQQVRQAHSPVKSRNVMLNELTQEFSPSPVKRVAGREMFDNTVDTEPMSGDAQKAAAPQVITSTSAKAFVSLKRVDVAQFARKNAAKQAAEATTVIEEENEDDDDEVFVKNLPRGSDAFQPTPARFSNRKKGVRKVGVPRKKVAEVEDAPDELQEAVVEKNKRIVKKPFKPGDSRPSEADLGFAPPRVPSPRAPSEMSEVTFNFKKPSVMVPTQSASTKRKEAPEDLEAVQGECRYLQSWIPRLRNKRLYVEGDLLDLDKSDMGLGNDQRWVTSKIVKRVSSNRVATKKGTVYVLEGQLVVRNVEGDKLVEDGPTPHFIIDKFKEGFPENWERLVNHWIKFNDQNSINSVNMSVFNSTSMTNMSISNLTALSNISGISANNSRFLNARGRLPNPQLSINMGANLSILPEEEQDTTRPQFEVIVDQTTSRSRISRRKSGGKVSERKEKIGRGERSRSPLRSVEEEEEEEREMSTKTEHRSRSKTVRYNSNSTRAEEVQEKNQVGNMLEVTMSQHDFTLLRAKNYDNTVMVNKKKNYNCHFCEFLTPLFNSLKLHIKKHHLDEGAPSSPTGPRAQSNESVLAAQTPARPKPRRSSFSPSKVANLVLGSPSPKLTFEEQVTQATISKNNYHCKECNFKSKYKSAIVSHLKSKKHAESEKSARSLSKKSLDRSRSKSNGKSNERRNPEKKDSPPSSRSKSNNSYSSRSKSNPSKTPPTNPKANPPKANFNKSRSPAQAKQQSPSMSPPTANLKRRMSHAPGLGTYVCFACDMSYNEDVEMFTHLMTSGHTKKVKTCVEKKFLSCNVCMINMSKKDDYIKHMRTKKHVKTLTSKKGAILEKDDVDSKAVDEEQSKDNKKQSRFGRNIKKTKALTRESCVYGTPEEIVEEEVPSKRSREAPNSKNIQNSRKGKPQLLVSPRRTVLNPFKRIGSQEGLPARKPVKSTEDIFEKVSANPKTVKQRQQNAEALKEYNENHEDDIFGQPLSTISKPTLLKASAKSLLNQDSDSDSEQDISVHSARTPMTSYFGNKGLRTTTPMLNQDKTPGILFDNSPLVSVSGEGFQAQAYIHKKVAEKAKDMRKLRKHKLATALVSKIVSRTQADKMVDESSQVINTVTNHTAGTTQDEAEEGDEADDWFDDDQETNLSCDPGAGLLQLLAKQPAK